MGRKKQTKKKSKVYISAKTAIFLLVAALFGLYYFYSVLNLNSVSNFKPVTYSPSFEAKKEIKQADKIYSATPTPTPKETPTNVPLAGFCLHVPVLMYHHIQPYEVAKTLGQTALTVDSGIFDTQMQYLAENGYTTLFANEFANALINKQQLPAKSVVITIDDGYEDNFIYALPVLRKYGIKANIMLASGLMGNSNMLSWNQVRDLKASGLIHFSNHTWSHHPMNQGSNEKLEYEITTAQKEIEENTGQKVDTFTYPYGALSDRASGILQKLGYTVGFSEIPGQDQCDSFMMTIHRTRVGNSTLAAYGL